MEIYGYLAIFGKGCCINENNVFRHWTATFGKILLLLSVFLKQLFNINTDIFFVKFIKIV